MSKRARKNIKQARGPRKRSEPNDRRTSMALPRDSHARVDVLVPDASGHLPRSRQAALDGLVTLFDQIRARLHAVENGAARGAGGRAQTSQHLLSRILMLDEIIPRYRPCNYPLYDRRRTPSHQEYLTQRHLYLRAVGTTRYQLDRLHHVVERLRIALSDCNGPSLASLAWVLAPADQIASRRRWRAPQPRPNVRVVRGPRHPDNGALPKFKSRVTETDTRAFKMLIGRIESHIDALEGGLITTQSGEPVLRKPDLLQLVTNLEEMIPAPFEAVFPSYQSVKHVALDEYHSRRAEFETEVHREQVRLDTRRRIVTRLRRTVRNGPLLNWEFLPPGADPFARIRAHYRSGPFWSIYDEARLRAIWGLRPACSYLGRKAFGGYQAFVFSGTEIAILECPLTGNATYVFRKNWRWLSRQTKGDLLRKHGPDVVRVIHVSDWVQRLRDALAAFGFYDEAVNVRASRGLSRGGEAMAVKVQHEASSLRSDE